MPVKIFERTSEALDDFEGRINRWMAKLDFGAVRGVQALSHERILIWYEGKELTESASERG